LKWDDVVKLADKIRWDLTPQTANISGTFIESQADLERYNKLAAEKVGYYFYVDVWNCQARLALMHNFQGGGRSEVIEDFDSPLLARSVESAGGWINMSGWYPINSRLERVLRRKLQAKTEAT